MKQRFYYNRSHVYGWCVYDRDTNSPAWDACAELLPPVYEGESGKVTVDPCRESEIDVQLLCLKLNRAHRKQEVDMR